MRYDAKILLKLLALAECMDIELSKSAQEIYLNALEQFDDDSVVAAINRAGMECKFFPKPAELIEFIKGPKPSQKDAAAVAWSKLISAIEQQGAWKSVVFRDAPIMSAVRAMGGWERVCEWETEEMHWRQKEFCDLYSGLHSVEAPAYLPGTAERANISAGYKTETPALADGDSRKFLPMPQRTDREILMKIAERAGL